MFTVKSKSKIPRTESYPLKASEVSEALSSVPQAKLLEIKFWRYVRIQDRDRKVWPLVALTYSRSRVGISTSNGWIAEGWLGPSWQLTISPVPKTMRHAINSLLIAEALPKLKVWLEARKDLHGKFGRDGIHVSFDQESEQLRYECTCLECVPRLGNEAEYRTIPMSTNESIPLYRDGRHYDALNSFLVADIPFYVEEARRAAGVANPHPPAKNAGRMGHPVLELACGTGRLTIPIAQSGVQIVGLDLSSSMLSHARAKAEAARVSIEFVEGDCRSFDLGRKFGLIFMAFNSMQHLHDYASLVSLFANVRKHLAEGGRFVFDVFNPKIEILARAPGERRLEREYQDPDGRGTMAFEHSGTYDDATQVSHIQCYFVRRDTNGEEIEVREEQLHLRSFFPQELDLLVRSQGFEVVEKFGNFERRKFGSGDPKQVVVCRLA